MISQIDNIGIATHDRTRSVDFYQKLGFAKAFENERGCLLVAGKGRLFVFDASADRIDVQRSFELTDNPPGIDHVSFLVDDVDFAYAEAVSRGIKFESAPADQAWGARAAMVRDPDGNNLYLLKWLR